VPYLEKALAEKPSLETIKRLEDVIERVKAPGGPAAWMRARRAIIVLESRNTPAARDLLADLAKGRAQALPTQDAEGALDRLNLDLKKSTIPQLWIDLSSKDDGKALRALLELERAPKDALPLIAEKVDAGLRSEPKRTGKAYIADLINRLSADDFQTRERATMELQLAGKDADAALRQAVSSLDIEIQQRAKEILAARASGVMLVSNPKLSEEIQAAQARCRVTARITSLLQHIDTDESRDLLKKFEDHTPSPVVSLLSPDGARQVKATPSKGSVWAVQSVDVATGKLRWYQEQGPVTSLAYSSDGTRVASGGANGKIYLLDGRSGKLLNILEGHTAAIIKMEFSPDNKSLKSSSADKTTHDWDTTTGKMDK
jgi:hypothetical protein